MIRYGKYGDPSAIIESKPPCCPVCGREVRANEILVTIIVGRCSTCEREANPSQEEEKSN